MNEQLLCKMIHDIRSQITNETIIDLLYILQFKHNY